MKTKNIDLLFIQNASREKIGIALNKYNFSIGMEIGVQKGIYTEKLLRIWKLCSEYTMIDPWIKQNYYDDGANVNNTIQSERFIEAMKVTEKFSYRIIFKIFKTKSELIYHQFKKLSYDFIYIDGRHDYYSVRSDLNNYFPVIKRGGILCGDDYSYSPGRWKLFPDGSVDTLNRSVKGAVDEFVKLNKLKLYISKDKSWCFAK